MKRFKVVVGSFLTLAATSVFAVSTSNTTLANASGSGFQVTGYVGATTWKVNPSNIVFDPAWEFDTETSADTADVLWGAGVGYDFMLAHTNPHYLVQDIALNANFLYFAGPVHGEVYQWGQPYYENYNYRLDLHNARVMFDAEIDFHPITQWLMAFIQTGIGINRTTVAYSENLNSSIEGGVLSLETQTNLTFATDIGAGLKAIITRQLSASFRYLYTTLEQPQTSTTPTTDAYPLSEPIVFNFNTNSYLFGLTYSFT